MKLRVWDRLLSALAGLVVLFVGLVVFVFGANILPFSLDFSFLQTDFVLWQRLVISAAGLVLCALGIHGVTLLFARRREKGFILQRTEYGNMSISMQAMENMVKKCVDAHRELKVTGTRIHHTREGVVIHIRIALANGVNIPLTVNALQKQIKNYITSCSGIDVKEVRVMVETTNGSAGVDEIPVDLPDAEVSAVVQAAPVLESIAEATSSAVIGEEAEKEAMHQRIFRRAEEPQIVPAPPVVEEIQPEQEAEETDDTVEDSEAIAEIAEQNDEETVSNVESEKENA